MKQYYGRAVKRNEDERKQQINKVTNIKMHDKCRQSEQEDKAEHKSIAKQIEG